MVDIFTYMYIYTCTYIYIYICVCMHTVCLISEEDALKEEMLAQHGVLEEYIAFDCR